MARNQKRPGPKQFKSNLLAANQENILLKVKYEELARQYSECVALFCAVVMEKHDGKVHIPIASAIKWQHHLIGRSVSQELGILTIDVNRPGTKGGKPQLVVPEPAPEPESATAPSVCENEWHKDANALGLRCPDCGGKGKLREPIQEASQKS